MNKLVQGNRAALLSDSYVDEIHINNSLNLVILDQHVRNIYKTGTITVPADGYIYSLNGTYAKQLQSVKPGAVAIIDIKIKPQLDRNTAKLWQKMPFIVGGGPIMIQHGRKQLNFSKEQLDQEFLSGPHARTAIGIMPDKRWVFVVVEGSLLDDTSGVSVPQLRDFMFKLGCVEAINLDGGGSSSMYIDQQKEGALMDRPVADAILILPRDAH